MYESPCLLCVALRSRVCKTGVRRTDAERYGYHASRLPWVIQKVCGVIVKTLISTMYFPRNRCTKGYLSYQIMAFRIPLCPARVKWIIESLLGF
jgi:hypothetical protein